MEENQIPMEQPQQQPDPIAVAKYWLRRKANGLGGGLLVYQLIMNACVLICAFTVGFSWAMKESMDGQMPDTEQLLELVTDASGFGYILAVCVGLLFLLLWKKPRFFRYLLNQRRKKMTLGDFLCLTALVMAPQVPAQLCNLGLMWLLEALGLDPAALDQLVNADGDSWSMFLYIGILAPVTEEILFRGLLQETVAPYGKKIAVWGAALLFGLYHANPIQTPYAILVGLVLGYVALEYHIGWAILLHMCNNLLFALLLPEALSFLPVLYVDIIIWALILGCFVASILILIRRWEAVLAWWRQDRLRKWQTSAFFGAPTVVILMILCLVSMVSTVLLLLI